MSMRVLVPLALLLHPVLAVPKSQDELLKEDEEAGGGPLHAALQKASALQKAGARDLDRVRAALDAGASLSVRDPLGYTALHRAADDGHANLVALLLERGAAKGYATTSDYISRKGKAIDSRDNNDATALMLAAGGGHADIINLLADAGADLAAADEFGLSPLHYAAEGGHTSAIAALIAHGADPDAQDEVGKTPSDVARAWGFPEAEAALGPTVTLHDPPALAQGDAPSTLPEGAVPLFPNAKKQQQQQQEPAEVEHQQATTASAPPPSGKLGDQSGGRRKMKMPDNLQPEKLEL